MIKIGYKGEKNKYLLLLLLLWGFLLPKMVKTIRSSEKVNVSPKALLTINNHYIGALFT